MLQKIKVYTYVGQPTTLEALRPTCLGIFKADHESGPSADNLQSLHLASLLAQTVYGHVSLLLVEHTRVVRVFGAAQVSHVLASADVP